MRAIFIFITLLLPLFSYASSPQLQARHFIDKVLVVKSERSLHLMHRGDIIKTYRVSLGKKPGKKEYEGDQRTPEGTYWINWRRPSKNYTLSMHISYPNASDLKRAQERGRSAVSMIMLHGTPIDGEYPEWFFHSLNWTDGCIALKNDDMKEVWNLVKDGTLIEITP